MAELGLLAGLELWDKRIQKARSCGKQFECPSQKTAWDWILNEIVGCVGFKLKHYPGSEISDLIIEENTGVTQELIERCLAAMEVEYVEICCKNHIYTVVLFYNEILVRILGLMKNIPATPEGITKAWVLGQMSMCLNSKAWKIKQCELVNEELLEKILAELGVFHGEIHFEYGEYTIPVI